LPKLENLKMMLGATRPTVGLGKALVRGRMAPESPAFKLFWKTHDPFPNSSNSCCKLQITVWFWCKENHVDDLKTMEEDCDTFPICTYKNFESGHNSETLWPNTNINNVMHIYTS